jgi:hypothetical protein
VRNDETVTILYGAYAPKAACPLFASASPVSDGEVSGLFTSRWVLCETSARLYIDSLYVVRDSAFFSAVIIDILNFGHSMIAHETSGWPDVFLIGCAASGDNRTRSPPYRDLYRSQLPSYRRPFDTTHRIEAR